MGQLSGKGEEQDSKCMLATPNTVGRTSLVLVCSQRNVG